MAETEQCTFLLLALFSCTLFHASSTANIGVNYGTVADNLPPPSTVAAFLKSQTTIDRVKLFDANPAILRAFAGTGISVTVTVPNADIPSLSTIPAAQAWLSANLLPFLPATSVRRLAVGNEVLATSDKTLISHILPTMTSLHEALTISNLTTIQVSTPHSLGILSTSNPPSAAAFRRGYDKAIFAPILNFHRETKSPFMINPYPFFGFSPTRPESLAYALFKPSGGVLDPLTGFNYTNMFDAQMDAVFSAMKRLGYADVELVVAETGWPSVGDPNQASVGFDNAASYNGNLIKHVNSGRGTPLMPNRTFETYVFSLFNENLKPTVSERNYGLFKPDLTPVYHVGVFTAKQALGPASRPTALTPSESPVLSSPSSSSSSSSSKKWCVPETNASEAELHANIDFVCRRSGIDCGPIKDGGPCFKPNTVRSHAAYAMNAYYQASGRHDFDCNFGHTGLIIHTDPSYESCTYPNDATGTGDALKVRKPNTGDSLSRATYNSGSYIFLFIIQILISFCFF